MKHPVTALVSMPWANLHLPSIQIGTLEAVLRKHDLPVHSFSMFLHYMDFMRQRTKDAPIPFTIEDYYLIADWSFVSGMGDWAFAGPPYSNATQAEIDAYLDLLKPHIRPGGTEAVLSAREHSREFVDHAVQAVLRVEPDIVGFTTSFSQNVPSLALAKALKEAAPNIITLFGGANCEGVMGETLIESFPWIDYVVRGEGEYALPQLIAAISGNGSFDGIPGLCYRDSGGVHVQGFTGNVQVKTADIPEPVYDEYFATLARSGIRKDIDPNVRLPVESSRGCWWGEKHHCTFCGLNGLTMAFRSKAPETFLAELLTLSDKYGRTSFHAADNILDMRYFKTFLPALIQARESGCDFNFFYEIKANLKKEHVAMLAAGGVNEIQPGIESMSTRILELIDKGVTALQNVQLLKWAREYDISVEWNLIYGFPGESDADWEQVHDLIPLLNHLQPPNLTPLLLERFSPYYDRAQDYKLLNRGPKAWYKYIYPIPSDKISDMVYYFDYDCEQRAGEEVIGRVRKRLEDGWNTKLYQAKTSTLTYTRGRGFVKVSDRRFGLEPRDMILRGLLAEVFLRCDAISTAKGLAAGLARSEEEIEKICRRFVDLKIFMHEGNKYLALPTSVRAMASASTSVHEVGVMPLAAAG